MKYPLLTILGLFVLLGSTACTDQDAQDQIEMRDQLLKAADLIHQAEIGFVPQGQENTESQPPSLSQDSIAENTDPDLARLWNVDLQAYRLNKLHEAAKILEPIHDKGPAPLQIAARRLLGNAYAIQINEQTRSAVTQWAQLAHDATTLYSQKIAATRAAWNAKTFESDESDTQILAAIRQAQSDAQSRLAQLNTHANDLRGKTGQIARTIDSLHSVVDQATTEADQLRTKALVAVDQQQYDLYDKAHEAQRRADKAAAQAREAQVNQDLYQSELTILTHQAQLVEDAQRFLDNQAVNVESHRREMRTKRDQSLSEKATRLSTMDDHSQQLLEKWAESVDQPLEEAAQRAEHTVSLVRRASQLATDIETKRLTQLDLLAQMIQRVHVLASHLLITQAQAHLMRSMAAGSDAWDNTVKNSFAVNAEQAEARQAALWETADQALKEALELTTALTENPDKDNPVSLAATQWSEKLTTYRQKINALKPEAQSTQLN